MAHCLGTADCRWRKRPRKPILCHPASAAFTILLACSIMNVVCANRPPCQVSSAARSHHPPPTTTSKAVTTSRAPFRQMLDVPYVDTPCLTSRPSFSRQQTKLGSSTCGFLHCGGVKRLDSARSASGSDSRDGMAIMMGTTRAKRTSGRGRPTKTHGVAKKVRRILEPASQAEVGVPSLASGT